MFAIFHFLEQRICDVITRFEESLLGDFRIIYYLTDLFIISFYVPDKIAGQLNRFLKMFVEAGNPHEKLLVGGIERNRTAQDLQPRTEFMERQRVRSQKLKVISQMHQFGLLQRSNLINQVKGKYIRNRICRCI